MTKKLLLSSYFLAGSLFLAGCGLAKSEEVVDFEACCRNCAAVPQKSGNLSSGTYREPRTECKKICTDFFSQPRCPFLTELQGSF